jgi:hypothetical protein
LAGGLPVESDDLSRKGYNRVDGVLDPRGEGVTSAWMNESELRQIYKLSRWKFHNLLTAIEVLKRPVQVWQALRQASEEKVLGYAYVGRPPCMRDSDGNARPLASDRVFIVFLDLRMTLLEWRTEVAPDGGFAEGERFKELLWSR